jgi:hypothetical protein
LRTSTSKRFIIPAQILYEFVHPKLPLAAAAGVLAAGHPVARPVVAAGPERGFSQSAARRQSDKHRNHPSRLAHSTRCELRQLALRRKLFQVRQHRAFSKLQRAGAVQDAARFSSVIVPREASWTAVALHRFFTAHQTRTQIQTPFAPLVQPKMNTGKRVPVRLHPLSCDFSATSLISVIAQLRAPRPVK